MAEGVVVPFTADLTELRSALDRLASDTSRRPISVPIGGGGGAGGSFSSAGPTVAGVFGASRSSVQGAFGGLDRFTAPGFAAPFAQGGFFSAGTGGLSAGVGGAGQAASMLGLSTSAPTSSFGGGGGAPAALSPIGFGGGFPPGGFIPAGPTLGPVPSGGGPGGSTTLIAAATAPRAAAAGTIGRFNSFGSRLGVGDILGLGGVASGVANVLTASRQYNIDSTLAGNDQRAQLNATLAYRESLAGSFGFVSRSAAFLQDPTGSQMAGIQGTLRSADAADARTAGLRDSDRVRQGLRGREFEASTTDPYERRIRSAQRAHDEEIRLAEDRRRRLEALDREDIRAQVAAGTLDEAGANRLTGERATKSRQRYDADVGFADRFRDFQIRDIGREEGFRRRAAFADLGFEARGNVAGIFGDAAGERRAGIAASNFRRISAAGMDLQEALGAGQGGSLAEVTSRFQRIGSSLGQTAAITGNVILGTLREELDDRRDRYFREQETRSRTRAILYGNERDPERAALENLENERQQAIRGKSPPEVQALNEEFRARRGAISGQFRDTRELRQRGFAAEGRILDAALSDSPFSATQARGVEVRERAFLRAEELRREDQPGSVGARRLLLENATKESDLVMKEFVNRFKATEVDINRTAMGGDTNREVVDALNELRTIGTDIRAALNALGVAR